MTDLYRQLFVHRSDVFAQQHRDGHYEPVRRPLEDVDIAEHLDGMASYGVYVIDPEPHLLRETAEAVYDGGYVRQSVHYAVFDLDTSDSDALAFLCLQVERLVGATWPTRPAPEEFRCLLLEDSGGKGYHLWLFLDRPTPAARVRAWTEPIRAAYQEAARNAADARPDAAAWPALEIFPKQDAVPEGGYGNLVKLPLGRHAVSGALSRFVRRVGWALQLEDVRPFRSAQIPEAAPQPVRRPASADGERLAPFPCVSRIIAEGAGKGQRDNALYHFARYAVGTGLPDDLVGEWVERVNEGFSPPMLPREVAVKVRSACQATTAHPGCNAEWLRDYCPGGPHCFAPWNDQRERGGGAVADDGQPPAHLTAEERRAWRRMNGGSDAD